MELWDLYTLDRARTERTMRRGEPIPENAYHLVVHICVFSRDGRMLIQKRQPFKEGWPGRWDVSVGGSAVSGETSRDAAHRELAEELGIDHDFAVALPALSVPFPQGFDDIYLIGREVDPAALRLQPEEVAEARWATLEEILALIDEDAFIPYRKNLMRLFFDMRASLGALTKGEDHASTHRAF